MKKWMDNNRVMYAVMLVIVALILAVLVGFNLYLDRRALEYRRYRRTAPAGIYRRCLALERRLREMGICVAGTGGR